MENLKNINGNNNQIIFELSNGEEITKFNNEEITLLNNFKLNISGDNNTIKIKTDSREDIIKLLKKGGLGIFIFGHNNTVKLGKLLLPVNESIGLTGLTINIGNPPEDTIDPTVNRYASNCNITLGDNIIICGARLFLQDDNSSITIGNDCMISWGIDIWCTDVHTITDLEGNALNYGKSIEIGNHVWIGKDVKIGKNTKVSDDSIIGWGSIVTKKFEESNVVLAGNPAKIVKKDINWNYRDLQNYSIYKQNQK